MNTIKCFIFAFLVVNVFAISAKAQCRASSLDPTIQDICSRTQEVRDSVNTVNSSILTSNGKLTELNTNLLTLINLLKESNTNTSSVANSASTTNTKLTDTMTQIRQQNEQANEILHNLIIERFKSLPADLLTNPLFKEEIDKLKADILKEIDKRKP